MIKNKYTYLDAMTEIISVIEMHESSSDYPNLKAAVTHFLQNPDDIPQGLPDVGGKIIREYRPRITQSLFQAVPFPPPEQFDFKFIDLFAGIGGFRLAFQANKGKCVFSSEYDEFAQKTYAANYGEIPYGDIRSIDKNAIPPFDVLCAGFPCQPFSLAGVSKKNSLGRVHGFADKTQGTLFFEIAEILRIKRPAAFMLENVKNLESHDKGKTFEVIRSTLEDELGYIVNWKIVDGSNWVPQHRERLFIVGYNPDLIDITKEEIFIPDKPESGYKKKELKEIIRQDVTNCTLGLGTWATLERHKKHHEKAGNGFGYGLHTVPIKEGEITRTISARYHKDGAEILIEQPGTRPRHLTVDEAMQLQGYEPHKFVFPVSNCQAFRQIGNSVVWPAVRSCATQIAKVLKERRKLNMTRLNGTNTYFTLTQFLEHLDGANAPWLVKRLSGNDTGITGGHQSGLYIPKAFMQEAIPNIVTTEKYNPTIEIGCLICSHDCRKDDIQAKYYNNKYFPEKGRSKKYDEFRLTCWKGTPLQDVDNTGAICVLAGGHFKGNIQLLCWVSRNEKEEDDIEQWVGQEIEPGRMYYSECLSPFLPSLDWNNLFPEEWKHSFPSSEEIFKFVANQIPENSWTKSLDDLLLMRRNKEFNVFSTIERLDVLPKLKDVCNDVNKFIKYANSVVNRRKSRSGASLELNLASIFNYSKIHFVAQMVTEQNKKPDFVFPSEAAYRDRNFSANRLSMLAAKTCCKDRWRQVINEADRIHPKHLFTLQEGISAKQLSEMKANGIVLVVPEPNRKLFPTNDSSLLMSLTDFIQYIKKQQSSR